MKNNRSEQDIKRSHADIATVHVLRPDLIISSGIAELDHLCGGFKAGEVTLVDGNSNLISDLPNQLCVNTYRTFRSETIYIDGGMCADPYRIARYARIAELNQHEVLQNVVMSRAFTVYQLSTLIQELLEPMILKHNPRTLLIGMLPALFLDPEIKAQEAQIMLSSDLQKIQDLTSRYQLITVCTNLDLMPLSPAKGLGKHLYDSVSEIVQIKHFEQCTLLELIKKQQNTMIVRDAKGQLRLEAFGMMN